MIDNATDNVFEGIFEDSQTQQKIDDIAKKSGISSILVMKSHDNEMEVVLSGGDAGKKIYHARDKGKKSTHSEGKHALYCERVVNSNDVLEVQDAAQDPNWKDNEDLTEFGLGTYLGVPIEKDGKVVGTVCALNNKSIDFENEQYNVLAQLQKVKSDIESKI